MHALPIPQRKADVFGSIVIGQKVAVSKAADVLLSMSSELRSATPRCIVLVGPPGCGKRLLARSLADVLVMPQVQ